MTTTTQSFSKITLGTVQFGLDYGIANRSGKPSFETCRDIVAAAFDLGINTFDTAAGYGDSERILGKIFRDLEIENKVFVVSKCRHLNPSELEVEDVEKVIHDSLEQSLLNLQMDCLPVFMLHREQDLPWLEQLLRLKDEGKIGRVGASFERHPKGDRCLSDYAIEAAQIPVNLFDRRFSDSPGVAALHAGGAVIFARSAFLQGLLLMAEDQIPQALAGVIPARRAIEDLAVEAGLTMVELCLRYNLGLSSVSSVLIGVDSVDQLRENVRIVDDGPLPRDLMSAIRASVPPFSEEILCPGDWPKK